MMFSNRNLLFQGAPIFRWTMFVFGGVDFNARAQTNKEKNCPCHQVEQPILWVNRDLDFPEPKNRPWKNPEPKNRPLLEVLVSTSIAPTKTTFSCMNQPVSLYTWAIFLQQSKKKTRKHFCKALGIKDKSWMLPTIITFHCLFFPPWKGKVVTFERSFTASRLSRVVCFELLTRSKGCSWGFSREGKKVMRDRGKWVRDTGEDGGKCCWSISWRRLRWLRWVVVVHRVLWQNLDYVENFLIVGGLVFLETSSYFFHRTTTSNHPQNTGTFETCFHGAFLLCF